MVAPTVRSHGPLILWVFLLAVITAAAFQGSRGIWDPDEGFYVSTAAAMQASGDWVVPRLNHEPFLDKPPLLYWGVATCLTVLGHSEWGARAFHSLCFLLTTFIVYRLGASLFRDSRQGLLAALAYATMLIPVAAANVVTPDTPLTLWTTLAFLFFWKSIEPDARHVPLFKILLCMALGLGFLTKGPAALVPAFPMFVYLLLQRRMVSYFFTLWTPLCLAAFLAIVLPWWVAVSRVHPGALAYIWDNQFAGRLLTGKYRRNPEWWKALVIYGPVVILGALPWSLFLGRTLWKQWRASGIRESWRQLRHQPAMLFLATWFLGILLVLSAASSKLALYALPLFPALALAVAPSLARILARSSPGAPAEIRRGRLMAWSGAWVVALVLIKAVVAFYPTEQDARSLREAIAGALPPEHFELVAVDDEVNGLRFYGVNVENVTLDEEPYPFFVPAEPFEEEVAKLPAINFPHLFLTNRERRARRIRDSLNQQHLPYREEALPFDRTLFVTTPPGYAKDTVRLAVLGDAGTGNSAAHAVGNAMVLAYEETPFPQGILLLGDNIYRDDDFSGNWDQVRDHYFDSPFRPLIDLGLPFHAALGNHDYSDGLVADQIHEPLFHMGGRRYYSRVFGEGLVEVFVLDTIAIVDKNDREQVRWVEQALEQSQARWKIVVSHLPLYDTSRVGEDERLTSRLEDMFVRNGVNLVLSGHNHLYERLKPVRGIHHVTAGAGGKLTMDHLFKNAPQRVTGNDSTNSFVILNINRQAIELTAYDTMRQVIDEVQITKKQLTRAHRTLHDNNARPSTL